MTLSLKQFFLIALLCATPLAGCGDCSGPGGSTTETDDMPPVVVSLTPNSGDVVDRERYVVTVRFDEPMNESRGTITLIDDFNNDERAFFASQADWSEEGTVATFSGLFVLENARGYTARANADFEDLAGNTLKEHYEEFFFSNDTEPAFVVNTNPSLGEPLGLQPSIVFTFSEVMKTTSGSVVIEGPGRAEPIQWIDNKKMRVNFVDLAPATTYTLRFEDFVGQDLLPLSEPLPALEFSTIASDSPAVIESVPAEGEAEVDAATLDAITLVLRGEVAPVNARFTLSWEDGEVLLPAGVYDEALSTLTIPIPGGTLAPGLAYRLDLRDLRGVMGTPIDPAVYLLDGFLDFTTAGAIVGSPRVIASDPMEGSAGVSPFQRRVDVVFDQQMDADVVRAILRDGDQEIELQGSWNMAATRVTFSLVDLSLGLTSPLSPDTSYSLDLSAMRSDTEDALDATQPLLLDHRLDFTTRSTSGEDCVEPLTLSGAQKQGDRYTWSIAPGEATASDSPSTCDASGQGHDVVIRYEKTSDRLADGGKLLQIDALADAPINLHVTRASCPHTSPDADQLACRTGRSEWGSTLDVGPGVYHIWVAASSSSAQFPGARVSVKEVDAAPAGESCASAFTVASPEYSARPDGVGRWVILAGAIRQRDESLSCGRDAYGVDAVVAIEKVDDASLLEVSVSANGAPMSDDRVHASVVSDCEVAATSSRQCGVGDLLSLDSAQAPAGLVYVHVVTDSVAAAWPEVTIDVKEVSVGQGESCATALAATAGANSVAGMSMARRSAPACFGGSNGVEWYRYTVTEANLRVVTSAFGSGLAVIDAASGEALGCDRSAGESASLDLLLEPGQEVCVAAELGGELTSFDLQDEAAPAGASCATAHPLDAGASMAQEPSSRRYDVPSCFPASGDVTWYRFTATQDVVGVRTESGAFVGLVSASDSLELACSDGVAAARVMPGDEVCVAVAQGSARPQLERVEATYTGVTGPPSELPVTLPTMSNGQQRAITGDRWLSVNDFNVVMLHVATPADFGLVRFPRAGGAASILDASRGLTLDSLGYAGVAEIGAIYSLDDGLSATSRIDTITDGAMGSLTIEELDAGSSYPTSEMRALTLYNNRLLFATHTSPVHFYTRGLSGPQTSASLMGTNDNFATVTGLAADGDNLYVAGALVTGEEGIFRLPRPALMLSDSQPEQIAAVDLDLNFITAIALDDETSPENLYYRSTSPQFVGAIVDPRFEALDVGPVARVGDSGDYAMGLDRTTGQLVVFGSENGSPGRFYELSPR